MRILHRYSIRNPYHALLLAFVALAVATPGVLRLGFRTDGLALLPQDAPEVIQDLRVREEFGLRDPLVIVIRSHHTDGVYNVQTLRLAEELTAALRNLAVIDSTSVVSLTTELGHRVWPGTLRFRPYLVPFPESRDDLLRLRDDFRRIELYSGTLIGKDERSIAIQVGVPDGVDRPALYATISALVAPLATGNNEILVIGAPAAEALLGTHILDDLGLPGAVHGAPPAIRGLRLSISRHVGLVPIAILIMALVFLISFRDWRAVLPPIVEIGACIWIVFGVMGWLGIPVYLTTTVLPVILTAIGVADEIHIFTHYAQHRRLRPTEGIRTAVTVTMDEMADPVVKTSVTTAIGFLSFAASPIEPVRMFGLFMALGIGACMLWSLTVVPAMLVLLRPRGFGWNRAAAAGSTTDAAHVTNAFARAGLAVRRHRRLAIVLAVILLLAAPVGINRVTVQDSWIEGFAPESEFYRATAYFNEHFSGAHVLYAVVDTDNLDIRAEVRADQLSHHAIKLPVSLIGAADSLVGSVIRLLPVNVDPVRPDAAVRSGSSSRSPADSPADSPEEWLPPSARPRKHPWESRVESVEVVADSLLLRLARRQGSPVLAFQPEPGETFHLEIQARRLLRPEILRAIGAFERFVEGLDRYAVGGVIGPAEYIETTHFIIGQRREDARRIPDDPTSIARLWKQYGHVRGEERLRQAVDANRHRAIVTILMNDANFVDTRELMAAIREYERAHLSPLGIRLSFAGDVAASQALITGIVKTQTRSLLISLVCILLVSLLLTRSIRLSICFVIPCALAIAGSFAAMGWMGMPLGVATSMFAGMTLGIGIDFAIHLVERYRLAIRREQSREPDSTRGRTTSATLTRAALAEALATTGPAILIDGLAIALGFGVLLLSQVPANSRLGALALISIANCMLATLLLLPALLPAARHDREPAELT